ncbi:MAG TPA: YebC/PmpR family DNA-binding transcriptional regulator [Candidatus Desulfofervidus auxilii]|uniref:Probable transcriptional regulatory protein ENI35_04220 n=1 Tax=Desulfofervidus auxilii TaxID=1621989 RepID=A0A7C1VNS6_DESA2|nr:MAG: putative transcriptional regulatory protein [Candidatus Methanoperedenaceae archaeon GB37]CAD7778583.1 putative transcriptional regulatory protein [Candidatus Methanoperedenaceae archaeon GB37]HEC68002.1 YebC/PmpR family DNA-binding transcriptional regulator [Candidatus Desulfofervidus auxilii]
MSGHSKWAQIKRKKAATDVKRGKIFTKLIREIITAARLGGGDPDSNARLRAAIEAAKAENMPKENIERAIKKGTGELEGSYYEEVSYEGYGAGGIAILISALTDNRNRTVSELRYLFNKYGGNLGETGCVSWMFEKKGVIAFAKDGIEEERLMEVAVEAGAEDIKIEEDEYEVITAPEEFEHIKQFFDKAGLKYERAEITMICQNVVKITDKNQAERILKLMDALEDHDDVQKVYANFDIPDEILEAEAG